ncbi:hypothetical protein PC129_g21418 [Phytophthora cactorum]|nr:hypothetical protein Pcac1_g17265 [Phytophthora cactorum]KAG2796580.1 hypothetical protein PC111_g21666 [Phytophthora cactorum]KAG2825200.1 hypothetical protein PC113_g21936 [Phytophthora cactorum]KAG2875683.1 hypothetical protein PC114_g24586 [Phytophthora cactorum]KAG2882833.1 hypothetical protein PC115_g21838 [Phytophthora cactorum]
MTSTMTADAKSGGGLERFKGKSYTMWKDKLFAYVNQLDHECQTKLLEKRQPEAKVLMADFLWSNPEKLARRMSMRRSQCGALDKGKGEPPESVK